MNFNLHQPGFARPADDAVIQRPAKKIREDGDDVYFQLKTFSPLRSQSSPRNHYLVFSACSAFSAVKSFCSCLCLAPAFLLPSAERLHPVSHRANSSRSAFVRDQSVAEIPAHTESQVPTSLIRQSAAALLQRRSGHR